MSEQPIEAGKTPGEGKRCFCPYCEAEIELALLPFCQACQVTLRYCLSCNIPVQRDAEVCPQCGAPIVPE